MKYIKITGKIIFDPVNETKKHLRQSEWKKVALVQFNGEIAEYYAWFIEKRYSIKLQPPMRGAHVTFINDGVQDSEYLESRWEMVKELFNGIEMTISLSPCVKTNGKHWWFIIPETERMNLHIIRAMLGLDRPRAGLHMTIGHPNTKNIDQSNYITSLLGISQNYL